MHDCIIKEASDASKSQNEPLTTEESARLTELEAEIENHGSAVGVALKEIHDKRLFRAEYRTWAEYCEKRWHRTRSWGYRLVDFERAKEQCRQNGYTPPKNEGSFRAAKRNGAKQSKTDRPSDQPTKSTPTKKPTKGRPSKVIASLDEEFESFKAEVERWKNALSHADYLDLVYAAELGSAWANGAKIWNAAYVQNQNYATHLPTKHERYLALLNYMMRTNVTGQLRAARTYADAFKVLQSYPLHGKSFIPMQHLTDINYSEVINFNENDSSWLGQVRWMESTNALACIRLKRKLNW
jgi:hypothetical protein